MKDASASGGGGQASDGRVHADGDARIFTGHIVRGRRGRGLRFSETPPPPPPRPKGRPARVALMLALAHKVQQAIDAGEYRDRAEVARVLGLTRARLTQLLDLTLLAPQIQEQVLGLEALLGQEPVAEHDLRKVVRTRMWEGQVRMWSELRR